MNTSKYNKLNETYPQGFKRPFNTDEEEYSRPSYPIKRQRKNNTFIASASNNRNVQNSLAKNNSLNLSAPNVQNIPNVPLFRKNLANNRLSKLKNRLSSELQDKNQNLNIEKYNKNSNNPNFGDQNEAKKPNNRKDQLFRYSDTNDKIHFKKRSANEKLSDLRQRLRNKNANENTQVKKLKNNLIITVLNTENEQGFPEQPVSSVFPHKNADGRNLFNDINNSIDQKSPNERVGTENTPNNSNYFQESRLSSPLESFDSDSSYKTSEKQYNDQLSSKNTHQNTFKQNKNLEIEESCYSKNKYNINDNSNGGFENKPSCSYKNHEKQYEPLPLKNKPLNSFKQYPINEYSDDDDDDKFASPNEYVRHNTNRKNKPLSPNYIHGKLSEPPLLHNKPPSAFKEYKLNKNTNIEDCFTRPNEYSRYKNNECFDNTKNHPSSSYKNHGKQSYEPLKNKPINSFKKNIVLDNNSDIEKNYINQNEYDFEGCTYPDFENIQNKLSYLYQKNQNKHELPHTVTSKYLQSEEINTNNFNLESRTADNANTSGFSRFEPADEEMDVDYDDDDEEAQNYKNIDNERSEPNTEINTNSKFDKNIKLYVIVDTNIFLHNLDLLQSLVKSNEAGECNVVLYTPWMVINELDSIKIDQKVSISVQNNALKAIKFINKMLVSENKPLLGQTVFEVDQQMYQGKSPDEKILGSCIQAKTKLKNVILLTNDVNLMNMASINEISSCNSKDLMAKIFKKESKAEKILNRMSLGCSYVIQKCAEEAYGDIYLKMEDISKPPWPLKRCLEIFKKYWSAVFRHKLLKHFLNPVNRLLPLLYNTSKLEEDNNFYSFLNLCMDICVNLKDIELCKHAVVKLIRDVKEIDRKSVV